MSNDATKNLGELGQLVTVSGTTTTFGGLVAATTPGGADNSTNLATTAFVVNANATTAALINGLATSNNAALTGNPTAPTAAQFDSDTSIATTAFVQKALGNMQVGTVITTVGNFLASDSGGSFYIQTAGTYGLPLLSTVSPGATFEFLATVNGVVISRQGSDQILQGNVGITSETLANGDTIRLTKIGAFWAITGGTAAGRGSLGDYGSTLATTGYQKLPSGLIMQWGQAVSNSSGLYSVSFPVTFNQLYSLVCSEINSGNGTATVSSSTTSGCQINFWQSAAGNVATGSGITANWVAFGK